MIDINLKAALLTPVLMLGFVFIPYAIGWFFDKKIPPPPNEEMCCVDQWIIGLGLIVFIMFFGTIIFLFYQSALNILGFHNRMG